MCLEPSAHRTYQRAALLAPRQRRSLGESLIPGQNDKKPADASDLVGCLRKASGKSGRTTGTDEQGGAEIRLSAPPPLQCCLRNQENREPGRLSDSKLAPGVLILAGAAGNGDVEPFGALSLGGTERGSRPLKVPLTEE